MGANGVSPLAWIAGIIVAAFVSDEALAWSPRLARFLIHLSTRRLSDDIRERMREEFLADIEHQPGKLGKVVTAIDSFRGVCLINYTRTLPGVPLWVPLLVRIFDVFIATLALIIVFPLLASLLMVLWAESGFKDHLFDRRIKIGWQGQPFTALTIRVTSKGGKAYTRLGWVVSEAGFDYLPLLINVLRGDMSLVGPPPDTPAVAEKYSKLVPEYTNRYRVRPGITGLAQLYQVRRDSPKEVLARLRCDMHLIRNYSLRQHVRIVLATIKAVTPSLTEVRQAIVALVRRDF